jgi:nucleotide-binding universal stress UspA family protein
MSSVAGRALRAKYNLGAGTEVLMRLKPALNIRPKSILFATDFSRASENALRHAIAVARHYGSTLHLAHVVSSIGFTLAGPSAIAAADEAGMRDLQQLEFNLVADGALTGIKHDLTVRDGDVGPQIEALIDELQPDVVVLGTHGRRGIGRLFLGSVAEEIFRCAECPVITVGPAFEHGSGLENARQPRPVLVATDFKGASMEALPYMVTFAQERNVKLIMLHVIPTLPLPKDGRWETADDVIARHEQAEAEAIARLKDLLRGGQELHPEPEFVVKFGDPAEEILKLACARHVDVIGMGLHRTGYPQAASHFRRTIAYEVVCRANCAVFTARD